MQCLWLENGSLSLREVEPPRPSTGEALIRVLQAGICNTDLELVQGYYPYRGILGHEFVGRVEQGPESWIGQRVVGEINATCGDCQACLRGHGSHCQNRTVLGIAGRHGAFSDYLVLPVKNLHRVPDEITDDDATFTEPLAAALQIQDQVAIEASDRVLVVGTGKLGQLIARTLALIPCELAALGRRPESLRKLAVQGIATTTATDLTHGDFDIAVECTGNPEGFEIARRALRPRGTLVMKSTYAGDLSFDASAAVVDELTWIGSRCGPFPPALKLLAARSVEVADLVDQRFSLSDALEAFEKAASPGALKMLLRPG